MSWGIEDTKPIETQLEEYRLIESELNQKRETFGSIVALVCETLSCENCPVMLHNYDKRTKREKEILHSPCCGELYKWIVDEAKKSR